MPSKLLLLWFEAPLQSWGSDSKFCRRDSQAFPTKSGVAGLLLCALGASGPQEELLGRMAPGRQTSISFARAPRSPEAKPSQTPPLRDFHMVGSAYADSHDPWMSLNIPKTEEGKAAVGGGSKLTRRTFLQDAFFAVVLELPEDLAASFSEALRAPVFDIYLGRKCCVPSDIVFRGVFDSEAGALAEALKIAEGKRLKELFRVVDGELQSAYDSFFIDDVPLRFGERKLYSARKVSLLKS